MELLEKREIDDFNENVRKVFNYLTITGKYNVIGSASLKRIKYSADYDLNELMDSKKSKEKILNGILKMFREKFKEAKKDPNRFITDFKCGLDTDGEPLRWDYKDMMKGYKTLQDGRNMSFCDCLLIKSTLKLDMIVIIDSVYTEFSENYFLKFGDGSGNFFPHDVSKEHTLNEIEHSYFTYLNVDKNYFKAVKRAFAYKILDDKKEHASLFKQYIDFFNSETGLKNKIRADLDTLLLVLETKFRKPKVSDIIKSLERVRETYQVFEKEISKIEKLKTLPSLKKGIEKLRDKVYKIVNDETIKYLRKNKQLLL